MATERTDDLSGPRRDPDLGPAQPTAADMQEKLDLQIRARKLKHMQEQDALIEDANRLTRFSRPAA